jgi:hypothetical protein
MHLLNLSHTPLADIPAMNLQVWAVWAVGVVLLSSVLQVAAFLLVRGPVWSSADLLAQTAVWSAVLLLALAARPSVLARATARAQNLRPTS